MTITLSIEDIKNYQDAVRNWAASEPAELRNFWMNCIEKLPVEDRVRLATEAKQGLKTLREEKNPFPQLLPKI